MADRTRRRVIGLMSGTSIDGIDIAAAELQVAGDTAELTPLGCAEHPYPEQLREALRAVIASEPCSAAQLCRLDTEVGQAFAAAATAGIGDLAGGHADLITSFGQTLYHWVDEGRCLGTLQLGQPAWIAEATGLPVVSDLRARDVAAGGHGAPLASTLDALWLHGPAELRARPVAALNIGGIANITVVPPHGDPIAYDTGPGNALLDAAARLISGGARAHDDRGELARRGQCRDDLLELLLADPYYTTTWPKSTGKEHFNDTYLRRALDDVPGVRDEDLLRTLVEVTAYTIARECRRHDVAEVIASGGGVHNLALLESLANHLGEIELRGSAELGLPASGKEAYLATLLGWLTWLGIPANVPSATGARGMRVLGSITPGTAGSPPPPRAHPRPRRLRVTRQHDSPLPGH